MAIARVVTLSITPNHPINEPGKTQRSRAADLRSAPRVSLLLRVAKLIVDDRELPCIIRDVSLTGMRARVFQPLPDHKALSVEVSPGERHRIELVWVANDYAGFRFTDEVDIRWIVEDVRGALPKRPVRLKVSLTATICSEADEFAVAVQNISQRGASIKCKKILMIDELIRFQTDRTAPIYAKVRWRRHPQYGIVFEQPFQLDELARLLSKP